MADGLKKRSLSTKLTGNKSNEELIAPGDNAPAGKQRIIIDRILIVNSGSGTVTLLSKGSSTAITPAFDLIAGVPLPIDQELYKTLKTLPGEGLGITTTGGVNTSVLASYHYSP